MNISIFDIHVIDVYFTSVYSNPSVFDTGSVAYICNSKQGLRIKRRLAKGELTICVGSVSNVDMIKHRTLPLPSRLVFALSIDMIGLCLSQYDYSFKENTGYSVYLNNTFNGLAPKMNGLLNLDRSDTHVHAKRYKIVMIVPHTCGTAI